MIFVERSCGATMERARKTRLGIQKTKRREMLLEQIRVVKVLEFRLITSQTLTNLHFNSIKVDQLSVSIFEAPSFK